MTGELIDGTLIKGTDSIKVVPGKIGKKYDFKILSIKPSEYRMALKPIFEKDEKKK